jgi:hypothetical protein
LTQFRVIEALAIADGSVGLCAMIGCDGGYVYDTTPYAGPPPANEAIVASSVGPERIRQIAPGCSRSQDPENAVENTTVVDRATPRGLLCSIGLIAAHS